MRRASAYAAAALMLLAHGARAETPGPPIWTGFYVGGGLGAGTIVQTQTIVDAIGPLFGDTYGATGPFAALTAGYDHLVAPRVVAGVFADFELSRISNDSTWSTLLPFEQQRAWSFGGRLGFLATPSMLWYGFGGFARSTFEFDAIGSKDLKGVFVGGGVEGQLSGDWSVRVEYRFTQFRTEKLIDFCGCAWLEAETSSHTGRLLLIYRFGP